jgi:predicted RNase H-like nuclease (RuvC/YqgF family)
MYTVMAEEKVTACAKVPKDLYTFGTEKYTRISVAIIEGLKLLKERESILNQGNSIPNQGNSIPNQGNSIPNQGNSIRNGEAQLEENSILKSENEKLQAINEILQANIEELKKDKDTIQNTYNNYMLQMQTLINQKSIEAPGSKKPWWRIW